jgi:hypothetical protein
LLPLRRGRRAVGKKEARNPQNETTILSSETAARGSLRLGGHVRRDPIT